MHLPPLNPSSSPEAAAVVRVAHAVAAQGGRALLVGGTVRDALLGRVNRSQDMDVEVFGLPLDALAALLAAEGTVNEVGKSFAVLMVHGLDVDFSVPRTDRKIGAGHRGFIVEPDPSLTPAQAARRRDFTINSIAMDPLTGAIIDPFGGVADLQAGVLRPTDASTFGEDPLRALRAVQFAARFSLTESSDLVPIMAAQRLDRLPKERVWAEFTKLLLAGEVPSVGLGLLARSGALRFFRSLGPPERLAEAGRALDAWVARRPPDRTVALAEGTALLAGAQVERFAAEVGPPVGVRSAASALVSAVGSPHTPEALRAWARVFARSGTSLRSLARILGDDALLAAAHTLGIADAPIPVAVQGRDLVARGLAPGRQFAPILAACRVQQDRTGETDPDALLEIVLPDFV